MKSDLIHTLSTLGIEITPDDIPTILRLGVDKYLSNVRYQPSEESMSGIYILLNEMRQLKS